MFRLSNKQNKILKVAIPALILLGVILYFTLRKKPSNDNGKPTGVGAQFVEGYQTEYALGAENLMLIINFTTPSPPVSKADFDKVVVYTVECPDNKCPKLPKNPADVSANMKKYSSEDALELASGDFSADKTQVSGTLKLNISEFTSGKSFAFGIAYMNKNSQIGDFVYTDPLEVPSTQPGPISDITLSQIAGS